MIAGPAADRPLVGQINQYSEDNAKKAIARLEHIARWSLAARMTNPASTINPDDINDDHTRRQGVERGGYPD